jgi:hypothetical protein
MALEFRARLRRAALAALMNVDGCFEVGAALSPIRAREQEEVARLVAHPTPEMLLVQARSIEDLRTAVLDDPRSLLLDLAAGRLLSRKFVARSTREVERIRLVGEARVYVLDGSSSMLTDGIDKSRARMRDAIVLADCDDDAANNPVATCDCRSTSLFRRSSNHCIVPDEAHGDGRGPGHRALVTTSSSDRRARLIRTRSAKTRFGPCQHRSSPTARPIDGMFRTSREKARQVSVAVSVALKRTPEARELQARQRARGALCHFVDDERLADSHGRASPSPAAGPPRRARTASRVIRELDDLEITRRSTGVAANGAAPGVEGQRALQDAEGRDSAAVVRRYHRWFPRINGQVNDATTASGSDLEVLRILLATIAEVVGELGGSELRRQADAIELIERLLPDARLTPARYHAVIERDHAALADAFAAVHAAVGGADVGYLARLAAAQRKSRAR